MREERMKVLQLLDEGKITAEEASKLLETLNAGKCNDFSQDCEQRFNQFVKGVNEFATDVGHKLNTTFKEVHPKVKDFTRSVVSATADIADNISKNLNETVKNMEKGCCGEESHCCQEEKSGEESHCCQEEKSCDCGEEDRSN